MDKQELTEKLVKNYNSIFRMTIGSGILTMILILIADNFEVEIDIVLILMCIITVGLSILFFFTLFKLPDKGIYEQ